MALNVKLIYSDHSKAIPPRVVDTSQAAKSAEEKPGGRKKEMIITWTRDSGRLILRATSSRIKMSGYLVFENSPSSTSS